MMGQSCEGVQGHRPSSRRSRKACAIVLPALVGLLVLVLAIPGCRRAYGDLDLSMYQYRDTRNLVRFVYDAALTVRDEGLGSLESFRSERARFRTSETYLYIYRADGTNLFHAGMEELEGRNLWDVTDKNGKPVFQQVIEALEDANNPHAWVHYSWWEPGRFFSVPKSSCHFKVETPDGEELIVGGGLDYPHEEPEFARILVDDAVDLIEALGQGALLEISNPVSKYNYRDVRVFVFDRDGRTLIAPAINSTFSQTNLLECIDEVGKRPFVQALGELEIADTAWEVFMAKDPYQRRLIRKCLYVRATTLAGDGVYVAAITDLPEPPY